MPKSVLLIKWAYKRCYLYLQALSCVLTPSRPQQKSQISLLGCHVLPQRFCFFVLFSFPQSPFHTKSLPEPALTLPNNKPVCGGSGMLGRLGGFITPAGRQQVSARDRTREQKPPSCRRDLGGAAAALLGVPAHPNACLGTFGISPGVSPINEFPSLLRGSN